jgi:hypothetical protein
MSAPAMKSSANAVTTDGPAYKEARAKIFKANAPPGNLDFVNFFVMIAIIALAARHSKGAAFSRPDQPEKHLRSGDRHWQRIKPQGVGYNILPIRSG